MDRLRQVADRLELFRHGSMRAIVYGLCAPLARLSRRTTVPVGLRSKRVNTPEIKLPLKLKTLKRAKAKKSAKRKKKA